MGGIAFQKLNGGQTTANKQLLELEKANQQLDKTNQELKTINENLNRPEIWRLAKMYAPDRELTPVQFSFQGETSDNSAPVRFSKDDKMYYGRLQIQIMISDGNKGGARHIAQLHIIKGGEVQGRFQHGYKGNDDWPVTTGYYEWTGFFDEIILEKLFSHKFSAFAVIDFQGFALGDKTGTYEPPIEVDPSNVFLINETAYPKTLVLLDGFKAIIRQTNLEKEPVDFSGASYYRIIDLALVGLATSNLPSELLIKNASDDIGLSIVANEVYPISNLKEGINKLLYNNNYVIGYFKNFSKSEIENSALMSGEIDILLEETQQIEGETAYVQRTYSKNSLTIKNPNSESLLARSFGNGNINGFLIPPGETVYSADQFIGVFNFIILEK